MSSSLVNGRGWCEGGGRPRLAGSDAATCRASRRSRPLRGGDEWEELQLEEGVVAGMVVVFARSAPVKIVDCERERGLLTRRKRI